MDGLERTKRYPHLAIKRASVRQGWPFGVPIFHSILLLVRPCALRPAVEHAWKEGLCLHSLNRTSLSQKILDYGSSRTSKQPANHHPLDLALSDFLQNIWIAMHTIASHGRPARLLSKPLFAI